MGRQKLIPLATVIFISMNVLLRFSEVALNHRASQFSRCGTDISLNGHLLQAYSGITLLRCSLYCSENSLCAAFNFDNFSKKCELLSSTSEEFPSKVVNSIGVWHYHVIISQPTTVITTDTETSPDVILGHTTLTMETARETASTTMLDGTPKIKLTTNSTPLLTREPSPEQATEQMTQPATHGQSTSAGCDQVVTVTDFCDKTFTTECEKVATPNYPGNAPNDMSCGFSVQAPEGQEAQLFFDYFSFESHLSCRYDHVEVYNGLPPTRDNYRPPLLCGTSADPIVTTNGFVFIFVYTDENIPSEGMSLRLVFSKICGETFSQNGQEISSPFYPDPLPIGVTEYVCEFNIAAPTGSTVRIEFSFLHLELHNACIYDRIEFYDEADDDDGGPLVTVCGYAVPMNPIYLNTDSVLVKVISDDVVPSNGFIFSYWFQ